MNRREFFRLLSAPIAFTQEDQELYLIADGMQIQPGYYLLRFNASGAYLKIDDLLTFTHLRYPRIFKVYDKFDDTAIIAQVQTVIPEHAIVPVRWLLPRTRFTRINLHQG